MPLGKTTSTNNRQGITAKSTISGNQEYITSTGGALNTTATIGGSPLPVSGATTAAAVAIVDGSGNQISSFGGGTQYQELVTTSPATGTLSLGRYQISFPTLTNGQMNEPMLDSSSRLLVNGSGVTQPVSGTVTANAGTGTFNIQSNASINNAQVSGTAISVNNGTTDAGTQRVTISSDSTGKIAVTESGTWNVGSSSATGSAVPANAFYIGGIKSGNLTGLTLDASNNLNVNVAASAGTNLSSNVAQFGGNNVATGTGTGGNGIPRVTVSNDSSVGVYINGSQVNLNTYSVHSTSNATTTVTSSTAYVSSIAISAEVAGTTSTVTIQDGSGTPLKLVNGFSTTALTTTPTVVNFQTPVKMVSGISLITAGAVAATVDVWINYYA